MSRVRNRRIPGALVLAFGAGAIAIGCQVLGGIDDRTLVIDAAIPTEGPVVDASRPETASQIPDSGRLPRCRGNDPGAQNDCGNGSSDSCCASRVVTGGTFLRSYDGVTLRRTDSPATVSTFALDVYEVTVGRFRAFVNAGMGTQASAPTDGEGANPRIAGSGWSSSWNTKLASSADQLRALVKCSATYQTWTDAPGVNENYPINCATWYEAFAFCAWDGGRLATEAEWNYAASAGSLQRVFPWSNPPSSTTLDSDHAVFGCTDDGRSGCAFTDLARVGTKKPLGDSVFGQSDMTGNVAEWVLDTFDDAYAVPCTDCAQLSATGAKKVIRGGEFADFAPGLYSGARSFFVATSRSNSVGIRCAREEAPNGDGGLDASADAPGDSDSRSDGD